VTILFADNPAASLAAQQIGNLMFGRARVGLTIVAVPAGVTDIGPQVRAAEAAKTQMYVVLGEGHFCSAVMAAVRAVGTKTAVVGDEDCLLNLPSPSALAGLKIATTMDLAAGPDVPQFHAAMSRYGSGKPANYTSAVGYSLVLSMVRAANAARVNDLTADGLQRAIAAAPTLQYPLGGGWTYRCDGKASDISAAICSASGLIADTGADGSLSNYQVVNAGELFIPQ
jgi:hypothetical protein